MFIQFENKVIDFEKNSSIQKKFIHKKCMYSKNVHALKNVIKIKNVRELQRLFPQFANVHNFKKCELFHVCLQICKMYSSIKKVTILKNI